jgi:hypothetical protein
LANEPDRNVLIGEGYLRYAEDKDLVVAHLSDAEIRDLKGSTKPDMNPSIAVIVESRAEPVKRTNVARPSIAKLDATDQTPLYGIVNPRGVLENAPAYAEDGRYIGLVEKVNLSSNGKPLSLRIDAGAFANESERDVLIDAAFLRFAEDQRAVVIHLSDSEIRDLKS